MAKVTGLGAFISVADATPTVQTISNDVTNFTLTTPRAVQDTTGVDKTAIERLLLLADLSVTFNGVVNPSAGASHSVFSTITQATAAAGGTARATVIGPTSAGNATPKMSFNAIYTDYQITRATGGALTWQAPGVLSDGTNPTWA